MDKSLEPLVKQISGCLGELPGLVQTGQASISLGLRRSARLPVAAALHSRLQSPLLLITDRADHALVLAEELELWAPQAQRLLFPEPTPLFYENAAWGETTRRERLLALTTLAAYHIPGAPVPPTPPIIIIPARALMTRTIPRREFLKATRTLRAGQSAKIEDLVRSWIRLGYEHVNTVIAPGQFARRGGILDLWPPAEQRPVRLEFFGDEIETMRRFDPATQRTFAAMDSKPTNPESTGRILVSPAREYLLSGDNDYSLQKTVDELPVAGSEQDISEFQIPLLHPYPASFLDYIPDRAVILIDDRQAFEDTVSEVEEQAVKLRADYVANHTLSADWPIPYLTWPEIVDKLQDLLSQHTSLELGPSTGTLDVLAEMAPQEVPTDSLAERFSPGPRFGGRLKPLMDYLIDIYQQGEGIVLVSRQSARLQELWSEQVTLLQPAGRNAPLFIESSLNEGWIYNSLDCGRLNLLTDGEIFGWRRPKPRYRRSEHYIIAAEDPEAGYSDLQAGGWVVHVDHGVGRYTGLVRRTVDSLEREYLRIEYADEAQLYVPVHQVDRLTRYVGPDNRPPTPDRLGGTEWRTTKSHVKEAVKEVAQDLLELYARRSVVEGYSYPTDTTWQQELEASFPYIETEDQMRVLGEVKQDMEAPRPMDRLICGDVGYGKTEVALRAAFKAVSDGKQVAMLVPTTVLAQQHHHTFKERLAAFPVEVEMLSRFRTPIQQHAIIERLEQGCIDIVIGTHRLLSSDVHFKDLGLLIIDEEQRFGVTHKEALKKMRTEVDVLTLTATPIPRTLYMALSGVRDISTINTPPEERLPVVTHVGPYSPALARQAILRELERGGQVFFVHNRVQTIGAMHSHLGRLVPEARIGIAHGQMAENDLSARMEQFTAGEVDILLSTSIIESGLDIPNANTLIVDRADTFGLAQLYQLRGRVGRGAQRAYAYFFRHKRKPPSFEGRQRLDTIAEHTQLGAGFSIAMRDLEIRGTGDILGNRQHGHIAAVGFHLYTRLLAQAVRQLRTEHDLTGIATKIDLQVQPSLLNVELPLPASIPAGYISDKSVRLGIYRRFAELRSQAEVNAIIEELIDRFGPLPEVVQNLLFQHKVKLQAEKAGLFSISAESNQIVLRYPDGGVPERLPALSTHIRVGKTALWIAYTNLPDWQRTLVDTLQKLISEQKLTIDTQIAGPS
jgi:transcription-repair coupling factor (superfamily II helicase)